MQSRLIMVARQLLFFLLFLALPWVQAMNVVVSSTAFPRHKIIPRSETQAETFVFADGRQAQILSDELPTQDQSIGLELTETSCPLKVGNSLKCRLKLPLKVQIVGLFWTLFPGQEHRQGQIVKYRLYESKDVDGTYKNVLGDPVEFETNNDIALENSLYNQKIIPEKDKMILECDEKNLLHPLINKNNLIEVSTAASEINIENPETKLEENRSMDQGEQLVLKPISSHEYKIESVLHLPRTSMFLGQNSHWTLKKPDGNYCEMSFSTDFSSIRTAASEFDGTKPNLQNLKNPKWIGPFLESNFNYEIKLRLRDSSGVLE